VVVGSGDDGGGDDDDDDGGEDEVEDVVLQYLRHLLYAIEITGKVIDVKEG
jgi:hypothetical protein